LNAEPIDSGWYCQQTDNSAEWGCSSGGATSIRNTNPPPAETLAVAATTSPAAQQSKPEHPPVPRRPPIEDNAGKNPPISEHTGQQELLDEASPSDQPTDSGVNPRRSPALAKQPGWSCESDADDIGWNCKLVGADPAGQAHPVSDIDAPLFATPTYSNREEMLFRSMMARIPRNPWGQCTSKLRPPAPRISKQTRETAPVDVNADYSDIYQKEIITLSGNVDVTRADQRIFADYATYNSKSMILNARENVHYRDQDFSLYSHSAFLNLDANKGRLRNTQFIYDAVPARGSAKLADMESKTLTRYWDASYTTCAPGNQDWTLETGTLELDRSEGIGTATNAWLEASGYPIFYVPYIEFPIDDRRKSGILAPSFGSKDSTGFDLSIPYYWNIAPNYDAIIESRYMTRRGFLIGGEFRYLNEMTEGQINGEFIPYDDASNKTRGALSILNSTNFTRSLKADLDINYVSDQNYINDIGNALSFTNFSHLRSQANLRFGISGLSILTRLENYQTIDSNIPSNQRPYRRLPQVLIYANQQLGDTNGIFRFEGEYVNFQRSNTVTGNRFNIKPRLNWPIETAGAYLDPSVAVQFTQYLLHGEPTGTATSISRFLPIVSLDSGINFDRGFTLGDAELIQTLEPRIYYLYIPDTNQDDIPLFDTSAFDFTQLSLFRDNRFNSADRIGDANQVSVALTSRILEPETGRQRLDGTIGTIVYFSNRNVGLIPNQAPETDTTSNIVGELNGQFTDELSFRSGLQWNPYQGKIARGLASLQYRDKSERILNLAYRFRRSNSITNQVINSQVPRGLIEQADGSFHWPLFAGISGVGRLQYSLLDDKVTESFLGIEKESCCWRFRIIGRHWIQTTSGRVLTNSSANTGVFVQLELKGFSSFGDNLDQFLERNISGYEAPE